MAILNNTTITVDAVLTTKGRELLARNDGSFQITQFALADDEIDYNLLTTANDISYINFYRNDSSPASSDYLGYIKFQGRDSAQYKIDYGVISCFINDVATATDAGGIDISVAKNGSSTATRAVRITGVASGITYEQTLTTFDSLMAYNSGQKWKFTNYSSTTTIATTDHVVRSTASSAITLTLPSVTATNVGAGKVYIVYRSGAGTCSVAPTSPNTINNSTASIALTQYAKAYMFISDGTSNWMTVGT